MSLSFNDVNIDLSLFHSEGQINQIVYNEALDLLDESLEHGDEILDVFVDSEGSLRMDVRGDHFTGTRILGKTGNDFVSITDDINTRYHEDYLKRKTS